MNDAAISASMVEKALDVACHFTNDTQFLRRAGLQCAVVKAMQAAVSMVGIDELEQESRLMRARNERLQAELESAKRLIIDVYGMLDPREQARQSIERRTGNWFSWGVDRNAPALVETQSGHQQEASIHAGSGSIEGDSITSLRQGDPS